MDWPLQVKLAIGRLGRALAPQHPRHDAAMHRRSTVPRRAFIKVELDTVSYISAHRPQRRQELGGRADNMLGNCRAAGVAAALLVVAITALPTAGEPQSGRRGCTEVVG